MEEAHAVAFGGGGNCRYQFAQVASSAEWLVDAWHCVRVRGHLVPNLSIALKKRYSDLPV